MPSEIGTMGPQDVEHAELMLGSVCRAFVAAIEAGLAQDDWRMCDRIVIAGVALRDLAERTQKESA